MLGAAATGVELWCVDAAPAAAETCPVADPSCQDADSSSSFASDHQLIQTRGSLSLGRVAEHAPGDFSGRSIVGLGPRCVRMQNAELVCPERGNGCRVLANGMRGRTCREYCGEQQLSCVGAWEEQDDNCVIKETLTCEQTYGNTHDLLCECSPPVAPAANSSQGRLVWEDNFDGDRLDSGKWSIVSGGGGFGNNEQQYYSQHGLRVGEGVLRITAQCEEYKGHHFTSAKVQTKHLTDWGPGHRVEVRARLPKGKGTWPAIWMLPTDSSYGGWPRSGEIDIVEAVGCTQDKVYGTVHTNAFNHMRHTEKTNKLSADLGEWHVFAIEWTASDIAWYMDGQLYHSFGHEAHSSDKWPFDRQFFLILNLAVGGSWGGMCVGGRPSCTAHDEFGRRQVMEVDFARVYAL